MITNRIPATSTTDEPVRCVVGRFRDARRPDYEDGRVRVAEVVRIVSSLRAKRLYYDLVLRFSDGNEYVVTANFVWGFIPYPSCRSIGKGRCLRVTKSGEIAGEATEVETARFRKTAAEWAGSSLPRVERMTVSMGPDEIEMEWINNDSLAGMYQARQHRAPGHA